MYNGTVDLRSIIEEERAGKEVNIVNVDNQTTKEQSLPVYRGSTILSYNAKSQGKAGGKGFEDMLITGKAAHPVYCSPS